MSIGEILRILWMRKWIVLAAALSCFVCAMAATRLLPRQYEGVAPINMDILKPDPVTGQAISPDYAGVYLQVQQAIVTDYQVTGPVVDALGWTTTPQLMDQFNQLGRTDIEYRRWVAEFIARSVRLRPVDEGTVVDLVYTTGSPEAAKAIAGVVRDVLIERTRANKRASAKEAADWLEGQATLTARRLEEASSRLAAYQKRTGVFLGDNGGDVAGGKLAALITTAPPRVRDVSGPLPTDNIMQLAQLDATIATQREQLGPNNPAIKALEEQRAALAEAAAQERAARTAQAANAQSLTREVDEQANVVLQQRNEVAQAQLLHNDIQQLRASYIGATMRIAELRQQAASDNAGIEPVGEPTADLEPVFPNMPFILAGSVALGLFLGALAALHVEMIGRRVRGVGDLSATEVPVMAVVKSPRRKRRWRLRGRRARDESFAGDPQPA